MKKIMLMILCLVVLLALSCVSSASATTSEVYTPSENVTIKEYIYVETEDEEVLKSLIATYRNELNLAKTSLQNLMQLQAELDEIYLETNDKLAILTHYYNYYYSKLEELEQTEIERVYAAAAEEYPEAAYVWKELREYGFSDKVCAGIMGNLMAEVGGQTLNLDWSDKNDKYYGICQWSKTYEEVWDKNLEFQVSYLLRSIGYEFEVYGNKYEKDFDYNKFCALENEQDAALAFAKCYERCSAFSHKTRQKNASKALEYFSNL